MSTQSQTVADELARRKREECLDLPESLGDLVRDQAALMGDQKLAVWFEQDRSLTYRELDQMASALASSLSRKGVRKGSHVAVLLGNTPAYPLTWVALGRLGAAMVPVNTAYTSDEIAFILKDSDAQYLIIDATHISKLEGVLPTLELLDESRVFVAGDAGHPNAWETLVEQGDPSFAPDYKVSRNDLLNIQYTSGTTGFPKGCLLSHDYWVIHAHNSARHRRPADSGIKNVLIWAPFFYMDPMWQFLMTIRLGGTCWIANRMSLTHFLSWLIDYRIHYCIFPEPALTVHPPSERDKQTCLRYISVYSWTERARREVMSRFNVIAREAYGMTEIGTGTLVPEWACDKALMRTCGLPAAFRELRILDDEGSEVAPGETGELWVSGRSIFWGYYKRPQANAESFRGKWFRTGDLFRQDEDGFYYLVGRIKEMIKRSGENIAANEVEAVLRSLPGIEEAAAIPVPDPLRREEVKAYLKLRAGLSVSELPPETVLAHCAKHLAAFKVPRYLQYIETDFPRTPSRKIAKKRLIQEMRDPFENTYDGQEKRWR